MPPKQEGIPEYFGSWATAARDSQLLSLRLKKNKKKQSPKYLLTLLL